MVLSVDQLESVEVDVHYIAEMMANALAVSANIDAGYVKYVRGNAQTAIRRPLTESAFRDLEPGLSTWQNGTNQMNFQNPAVSL